MAEDIGKNYIISLANVKENGASNVSFAIGKYEDGQVFQLRSNASRSSATIMAPASGKDLAWFDKAGLCAAVQSGLSGNVFAARLNKKAQLLVLVPKVPQYDRDPATGALTERQAALDECLKAFAIDECLKAFGIPAQHDQTTKKENTMTITSILTAAIETNKTAATTAGYNEAGRIANNQLTKIAGKHLPMMLRGYADTALGKLIIANMAIVAAGQMRPNDKTLNRLTQAMAVAAYQEVIQTIDIEGMINGLLESPEIQRAISKLPADSGLEQTGDKMFSAKA